MRGKRPNNLVGVHPLTASQPSFSINNNTTVDDDDYKNDKYRPWRTWLWSITVGVLLGGIALSVVVILWLSPISSKATQISIITTTTTSPALPCSPINNVGTGSTIWTTTTVATTTYNCNIFSWTATTSGSVTFSIQLENDPYRWYLDDVSIYAGATQMLINGGFETGSLAPWVRTQPNGTCAGQSAEVTNVTGVPYSGNYGLWDGSNGCFDQIAQSFTATAGQVYVISFWLLSTGLASTGIYTNFSIV